MDQRRGSNFAFTAHDDVDFRGCGEDVLPVIAGENAAIDDRGPRPQGFDFFGQHQHGSVRRGRAGMADQHGVGVIIQSIVQDLRKRHRAGVGVHQPDAVPGVDQCTTDTQKSERRQVYAGNAAADGSVGEAG